MSSNQVPELESRPQGKREWSGWLTSLVLPLGFVVLLVGGLLWWQARDDDSSGSPYGTVELARELNATGQPPEASSGRAAPDFVLESMGETLLHLSDMQGRPVIVSFFTTWCVECRGQLPLLVQADSESADDDLLVLLVNLQEAEDRIAPFLAGYGVEFPVLLDRDGDVGSSWNVGGRGQPFPASFFIARDGVIRKVVDGPLDAAGLGEGLRLIAGGS